MEAGVRLRRLGLSGKVDKLRPAAAVRDRRSALLKPRMCTGDSSALRPGARPAVGSPDGDAPSDPGRGAGESGVPSLPCPRLLATCNHRPALADRPLLSVAGPSLLGPPPVSPAAYTLRSSGLRDRSSSRMLW